MHNIFYEHFMNLQILYNLNLVKKWLKVKFIYVIPMSKILHNMYNMTIDKFLKIIV